MANVEDGSIQFIRWIPLYETEKPFQVFLADRDLESEKRRNTNLVWEEKDVAVEDFRGREDFHDIDEHGFTSRKVVGFESLPNTEAIEKEYLPAVEKLLREELDDVGTVFIFDWRV